MKKFSTAGLLFALACTTASAAAPAGAVPAAADCQFLSNAPDQHQVVRGDTLWSISGRFLQHPWCWPQVWGLNREQIREILLQVGIYCGVPAAVDSFRIAREAFSEADEEANDQ